MSLFDLGEVLMTQGIASAVERDPKAASEIATCLGRHALGDWGDLCEEDRAMNDEAVRAERAERVFSVYDTCVGKIYVITERDRSATTVLFPEEY